jgi:peptide subunit release factor 1 (eRF1)
MNCLKCDYNISDLISWKTVYEIIECPNCKNQMRVEYDEDLVEGDVIEYWWVENHTDADD